MRKYGTLEDLERWRLHFEGTPNEFKLALYETAKAEEMVRIVWKNEMISIPAPLEHAWVLISNYMIPLHNGIRREDVHGNWLIQDTLKKNFGGVPLVVRPVEGRMYLTLSDPAAMTEQDRESCSVMAALLLHARGVAALRWDAFGSGDDFDHVLTDDFSLNIPLGSNLDEALPVIRRYFNDVTIQTT